MRAVGWTQSLLPVLLLLSVSPTLEKCAAGRAPDAGWHKQVKPGGHRALRSTVQKDGDVRAAATGKRNQSLVLLRASSLAPAKENGKKVKGRPKDAADAIVQSPDSARAQPAGPSQKKLWDLGHTPVGDVGLALSTSRAPGADFAASALQAVVATVSPGSPADKGGVRKGDVILSIDGVHVKPSCQGALDSLFEGISGSPLVVMLRRPGQKEPKTFDLVRRAGYSAQSVSLPHDLYAPGPCFACLPNPAPRMLGNVSIAFLWPAYLANLRERRLKNPNTANTDENAGACREAKIGYLRLVLDFKKYLDTGCVAEQLHALPKPMHLRLGLPPPPRKRSDNGILDLLIDPDDIDVKKHGKFPRLKLTAEEEEEEGGGKDRGGRGEVKAKDTARVPKIKKKDPQVGTLTCQQCLHDFLTVSAPDFVAHEIGGFLFLRCVRV